MKIFALLSSVALAQNVLVESAQPAVSNFKPQQGSCITVSTIQDAVLALNSPASLHWMQTVTLDSLKSKGIEKVAKRFARDAKNSRRLVVENPEAAAAVLRAKNEGKFEAVLEAFQNNPQAQEISEFVQESMEFKGLHKRINGHNAGFVIVEKIATAVAKVAVLSAVGGVVVEKTGEFILKVLFHL